MTISRWLRDINLSFPTLPWITPTDVARVLGFRADTEYDDDTNNGNGYIYADRIEPRDSDGTGTERFEIVIANRRFSVAVTEIVTPLNTYSLRNIEYDHIRELLAIHIAFTESVANLANLTRVEYPKLMGPIVDDLEDALDNL